MSWTALHAEIDPDTGRVELPRGVSIGPDTASVPDAVRRAGERYPSASRFETMFKVELFGVECLCFCGAPGAPVGHVTFKRDRERFGAPFRAPHGIDTYVELFGPPQLRHDKGALFDRPWGRCVVTPELLLLVYRERGPLLPLPSADGPRNRCACAECGEILFLPYEEAGRQISAFIGAAPCPSCGCAAWRVVSCSVPPLLAPSQVSGFPVPPDVARLLESKLSRPHQANPPREWMRLDGVAAMRHGADTWFCDGRWIHHDGSPARGALDASAVPALAGALDALGADLGHPRTTLLPFAALDGERTLWIVVYASGPERRPHALPAVLGQAARPLVPVTVHGARGLLWTELRRLRSTPDPEVFVLEGVIDAGAAAHVDDFIDLPTWWRLDLRAGRCEEMSGSSPPKRSPGPAFSCVGATASADEEQGTPAWTEALVWRRAADGTLTAETNLGGRPVSLRVPDTRPEIEVRDLVRVALRSHVRRDRILLLDLRDHGRAQVTVWET